MQIKNILALALVGFAAAAPMAGPTKSVDVIKGALEAIVSNLDILDTAVKGLSDASDPAQSFTDLTTKSSAVLTALQKGIADVTLIAGTITLTEALSISSFSNSLTNSAKKVVNDFIAKKAIIEKAGKGAEVVSAMQAQYIATGSFSKELKKKLPAAVQSIADSTAKAGTDALAVCFPLTLFIGHPIWIVC
jgi:hypothetical protein